MNHPSSLTWFRYAAQDLQPWELLALRWHTLRCPDCANRRARESQVAPTPPGLPGFSARPPRVQAPWLTGALASTVLVALAIVLVQRPGVAPHDLHSKGGSRFDLWVAGPPAHLLGNTCAVGETVQPMVETKRRYLIVVGIEPNGRVAVIFPSQGEQSVAAPLGRGRLPESWTFDATAGTERFVALFSDAPLERAAATTLAVATAVPSGVERIERACIKARPDGGVP